MKENNCRPGGGRETLEWALTGLSRPYVAVLGGPAGGGKLEAMDGLLDWADAVVVGGGLAAPFLKARGGRLGQTPVADGAVLRAARLLEKARARGIRVFLPVDTLAANEAVPGVKPSLEGAMALFDDKIALDIGPRTVELFAGVIRRAGAVVWSGPMGMLELPAFGDGTRGVVKALAESNAVTIAAGEDSVRAAEESGLSGRLTCLSADSGAVFSRLTGRRESA